MILLIYGASSQAKEVYDLIQRNYPDRYDEILYIDDFVDEKNFYFSKTIHFDSIRDIFNDRLGELEGIVAVGEPNAREKLTKKFDGLGIRLAKLIDKTALVSPTAQIDEGTIICEYSTIHANVTIGRSVLIQSFCDIGHDIHIGNYTVMSAGCTPGGGTFLGDRVYIGMNVAIKEKINIAEDAIVAMGSVVFRDVGAGATVIGNPARITKGNSEHKIY